MKATDCIFALSAMLSPVSLPTTIDVNPTPNKPSIVIEGQERTTPSTSPRGTSTPASPNGWTGGQTGESDTTEASGPSISRGCALWGGLTNDCPDDVAPSVSAPAVIDFPGEVRHAIEVIGLPTGNVEIQPAGEALVNKPVILYTNVAEFSHTTTLVGRQVDITAEPTRFTWHHGDGTTQTTQTAGAPYPSMDVTHTYTQTANELVLHVDIGYQVSFRVDGGSWQSLDTTITATGPSARLTITQAAPVIVHPQ